MGAERKARRVAFGGFEPPAKGDSDGAEEEFSSAPVAPSTANSQCQPPPSATDKGQDGEKLQAQDSATEPEEKPEAKSKKRLSNAELLMVAQTGGMRERQKLTQHPNDTIAEAAISTPGLPDVAIEAIAENTTTNPICFKIIAGNPRWSKMQNIVKALVFNPKTPVHVSRGLLPLLRKDVLEKISSNRELPDGLRALARKKLSKSK